MSNWDQMQEILATNSNNCKRLLSHPKALLRYIIIFKGKHKKILGMNLAFKHMESRKLHQNSDEKPVLQMYHCMMLNTCQE